MLIVNRYDLPQNLQNAAAALVLKLDSLIGERAETLRASPGAARRIRALAGRSWCEMEARFDQDAPRVPQLGSRNARRKGRRVLRRKLLASRCETSF